MEIKHIRIDIQPWHLDSSFTEAHITVRVAGERERHIVFTIPPHDFESLFDILMLNAIEELRRHFTTKEAGDGAG